MQHAASDMHACSHAYQALPHAGVYFLQAITEPLLLLLMTWLCMQQFIMLLQRMLLLGMLVTRILIFRMLSHAYTKRH